MDLHVLVMLQIYQDVIYLVLIMVFLKLMLMHYQPQLLLIPHSSFVYPPLPAYTPFSPPAAGDHGKRARRRVGCRRGATGTGAGGRRCAPGGTLYTRLVAPPLPPLLPPYYELNSCTILRPLHTCLCVSTIHHIMPPRYIPHYNPSIRP